MAATVMSAPLVIEVDDDDTSIDEEMLEEYEEELDKLGNFPEKVKINGLSMVAEDHASSKKSAAAIYKTIRKRLLTSPPSNLLPLVYLLDSILKNAKGEYVGVFEQDAPNWIPEVNRKLPDEQQRTKLKRTWETWGILFPHETWKKMGTCFDSRVDEKALISSSDVVAGISRRRDGSLILTPRLRQEMENVLDEMQRDMTSELDKVSLERLADKNPKLLGEIKQAAEANLQQFGSKGGHSHHDGDSSSDLPSFLTEMRSPEAIESAKAWHDLKWDGPAKALDVATSLEKLVHEGVSSETLYTQQEALDNTPYLASALATMTLLNSARQKLQDEDATKRSDKPETTRSFNLNMDDSQFTNSGVKQKNPAVVGMLYEVGLPFVSSTDGRRFRTQLELSKHLDALFRQNQMDKSMAVTDERGWYSSDSVWTGDQAQDQALEAVGATVEASQAATGGGNQDLEATVPADESRDRCVVCGIQFKMVFNADEGAYDYTNCREIVVENDEMALEESENMLVHVTCWRGLGSPEVLSADQALQDYRDL